MWCFHQYLLSFTRLRKVYFRSLTLHIYIFLVNHNLSDTVYQIMRIWTILQVSAFKFSLFKQYSDQYQVEGLRLNDKL